MKIETLLEAKKLALHFVMKVDLAIEAFEEDWKGSTQSYQYIRQNKHNAAAKRASMDLTRTLADLRLDR